MTKRRSVVISMRIPLTSEKRLRRIADRHGWTASDTSARLVEEGLRRAEFAFIDFRDSPAGRQAYIQGSSLPVWEVMLLVQSYESDVVAVARHLQWPETKVLTAVHYAEAFPEEVATALSDNESSDFLELKRILPQTSEFPAPNRNKPPNA